MLKIICLSICLCLMVLGFVELIKIAMIKITGLKNYMENSRIVIPIKNHNEEAEFLLRSAICKAIWENSGKNIEVICLDCGMDYETRKICELICKDYEFVKLYDMNDIDYETV